MDFPSGKGVVRGRRGRRQQLEFALPITPEGEDCERMPRNLVPKQPAHTCGVNFFILDSIRTGL